MLFENSRGEQCGFKTMNCSRSKDAAKSAHRVTGRLCVIRKFVEPMLNCRRRAQPTNESSLGRRKLQVRRLDAACVGQAPMQAR